MTSDSGLFYVTVWLVSIDPVMLKHVYSGIEMMSKSITSAESAPPIDPKFYENLFAAASTPPPE